MPLVPTPEEAFRAQPPALGSPAPLPDRPVHRARFDDGSEVWVALDESLPLVSIRVASRSGSTWNTEPGMALLGTRAMMHATLREGVRVRRALAEQGFSASVTTDLQGMVVELATESERLPEALAAIAELLATPALDEESVEHQRAELALAAREARLSPWSQALRQARGALYGDAHPLVRQIEADVPARVDPASVRDWHAEHVAGAPLGVIIVGDVEPSEALRAARDAFGRRVALRRVEDAELVDGVAVSRARPEVAAHEQSESPETAAQSPVLHVEREGQSAEILVLGRGPDMLSVDDWCAMTVLVRILGGMFASPLNLLLREERGASYGVSAGYVSDTHHGEISISVTVPAARAAQTVEAIRAAIEDARREVAEPALFEMARTLTREEMASGLEGRRAYADVLVWSYLLGAEPDDLRARIAIVDALDAEALRAAAERYLHPARMVYVIAGPTPP